MPVDSGAVDTPVPVDVALDTSTPVDVVVEAAVDTPARLRLLLTSRRARPRNSVPRAGSRAYDSQIHGNRRTCDPVAGHRGNRHHGIAVHRAAAVAGSASPAGVPGRVGTRRGSAPGWQCTVGESRMRWLKWPRSTGDMRVRSRSLRVGHRDRSASPKVTAPRQFGRPGAPLRLDMDGDQACRRGRARVSPPVVGLQRLPRDNRLL